MAPLPRHLYGQSATEFLICAVFVLTPMFLMVPLLGKYIDIKHAAVQSARYEAWEYTAWLDSNDSGASNDNILYNFNALSTSRLPFKEPSATRVEAQNRFFTEVGTEPDEIRAITANDTVTTGDVNKLWRNHRQVALFNGTMTDTLATDEDTPTLTLFGFDVGSLLNSLVDLVDEVFGLFSSVLSFLGNSDAGFTALNTDGFVQTEVSLPVRVHNDLVELRTELDGNTNAGSFTEIVFDGKAAVLTEGWNAGGTEHTYNQASGAIPSTALKTLLDLPVLNQIWDLAAIFAPELTTCTGPGDPSPPLGMQLADAIGLGFLYDNFVPEDGSLWLGYVDGDVVHPDRLAADPASPDDRLGSHVCTADGRCDWDNTVQALTPALSHSPCVF